MVANQICGTTQEGSLHNQRPKLEGSCHVKGMEPILASEDAPCASNLGIAGIFSVSARHRLSSFLGAPFKSGIKPLSDMEVFVQNIPFDLNSRKVSRGIENAIKKTFQRKIDFDWQRFKKKGSGKLTFPTFEMGQEFLNSNSSGITLRGYSGKYRTVRFSLSKFPPNARLVEGLRRRMEERQLLQGDSEEDNV